jgi:hypothetical protein
MKSIMYISGILGGLLLVIRLIGTIAYFSFNDILLISGLVLIVLIFIPLSVIEKYRHNKKIKNIIQSYSDEPGKHISVSSDKSKTKGWSMNSSPFRKRKSGLTWGGGNIKGANATRGTRKSFLNK